MKFDPENPLWTAYALDDASLTADERIEMTAVLAKDEDARAFVAEVEAAASLLKSEFASEPKPLASGKSTESAVRKELTREPVSRWVPIFAVAAALLICFGVATRMMAPFEDGPRAAMGRPSDEPMRNQSVAMSAADSYSKTVSPGRWSFGTPADPARSGDAGMAGVSLTAGGGDMRNGPAAKAAIGLEGIVGHIPDELDLDISAKDRPAREGLASGGKPVANTEAYAPIVENPFLKVNEQNALSTFSIDVDTASYSLVRRFLTQNTLPPAGAVRLEELINYFSYSYAPPKDDRPFATHLEIAECPWNPKHRLARIGIKGKVIDESKRPPTNLVFLIDISGSMDSPERLPLVKQALGALIEKLGENDHVAIAVYANGTGLPLDSTSGMHKSDIREALERLHAGGSTNGAGGLQIAYDTAVRHFIKGGVNRVILCTDGDFNVGPSSDDELVRIITEKAKSGVFLSVLGFGMGNYKDQKMVQMADKGNGNYAYIDTFKEAHKVLVEQMSGTLVTIAKDVKIQIEFNPQKVSAYRLLGYEKRMLKAEDFKDDKKDAGEIGAGHTVTALYELVPAGQEAATSPVDPLVFQKPVEPAKTKLDPELAKQSFRLKLRYKKPDGDVSTEIAFPGVDEGKRYTQASPDFQFAAAVASFGMLLRDSAHKGNATFASVLELAASARGDDKGKYREEFLDLVRKAAALKK